MGYFDDTTMIPSMDSATPAVPPQKALHQIAWTVRRRGIGWQNPRFK